MKTYHTSIFLIGALLCMSNSANAAGIYDNNMSALNINMLTDVFMSYASYGEKMSDLFTHKAIYGTMNRLDEYGDDGSTIKTLNMKDSSGDAFIQNIWGTANHINENLHYGQNISERGRFYLATVGATTRATELKYGKISFGGFTSYINTNMSDFYGNGNVVGIFSNYKYKNFGAQALLNTGAINNNSNGVKFNNSWLNIAADAHGTFKIDDTFFVRPNVYMSYTFVTSDDLYVDGDRVSSDSYNFFNISPALAFIKEVSPDWYGSLSAKYVAHMGSKNDLSVNGTEIRGLYLDKHTDIGIDVEHDYKQFVFGANVHKQIWGMDGWSANINVKYAF
jgi:hypothetical protein